MKHKLVALVVAGLLTAPGVALADLITLQLPGIPGDAKFAANYGFPADAIRVITVGNGIHQTGSDPVGGGGGAGKAVFSNLSVIKKLGESSPALFATVASGRHLQEAWIRFFRLKQGVAVKYYEFRLVDVVIASQKWVGNSVGPEAADTESVELAYARIEMTDVESGAHACFDLRTHEDC
jgi:type VI secretion system Hcp family effector